MLGPLYHLPVADDRLTAWREAARVVRPGGVVVAASISRFASMLDGFVNGHFDDPRFRPMVDRAMADGVHRNVTSEARWFTSAYFHRPEEPAAEAVRAGLDARTVVVEGPLWLSGPRLTEILASDELTGLLLEMMRRIEDEPSMLGVGSHLLTVAVRPA
jgi:hypothetical protein